MISFMLQFHHFVVCTDKEKMFQTSGHHNFMDQPDLVVFQLAATSNRNGFKAGFPTNIGLLQ